MEFIHFAPAPEEIIRRSQKAGVQMDFAMLQHESGQSEDELHRNAPIRAVRRFGKGEDVAVSAEAVPFERIRSTAFTDARSIETPNAHSLTPLGDGRRWEVEDTGKHATGGEDNTRRLIRTLSLG